MTNKLKIAVSLVSMSVLSSLSFGQWSYDYYRLNGPSHADGKHVDVQNGIDGAIVTGLVESSLLSGRPEASDFAKTRAVGSGSVADLRGGGDGLGWWTDSAANKVAYESSGTVATSTFDTGNGFFAAGESNNSTYMRSAHWWGYVAASGNFDVSISGDDDAFLFVNGELLLDNGGVKAIGLFSSVNDHSFTAGDRLDIFFADRNTVESRFKIHTDLTVVPEPATMAVLGVGIVAALRRRRK